MTAEKRKDEIRKIVYGVRKRFQECGVILILCHNDGQETFSHEVRVPEGLAASALLQDHFLAKARHTIRQELGFKGGPMAKKKAKKSGKKGK